MQNKSSLLPREKLELFGINSLSDYDLIAIIIGSGCKDNHVRIVARKVGNFIQSRADRFLSKGDDSFSQILSWTDLDKIKGLGRVKSMQIFCGLEFGRRIYSKISHKVRINSRADVASYLKSLKRSVREHVIVLCLDAQNQLICQKTVAIGAQNRVIIEPRDILFEVLKSGAAGFILVHNHPSGETKPSVADIVFTKRVKDAAEIIGVTMIDHVII
ncbi:DNA repair protein RadC [Candidatus Dojkabacteria bacterium]|nr:DNA repair protein RadC [Candidatus Dojkabacteria bacterium]